jgi:hypothetical protein
VNKAMRVIAVVSAAFSSVEGLGSVTMSLTGSEAWQAVAGLIALPLGLIVFWSAVDPLRDSP